MDIKYFVLFVHGFNVRDGGEGSVGKLRDFFIDLGCGVEVFNYGHYNILEPRWKNSRAAKRLAARVEQLVSEGYKCIVVAHSNGAAITHIAGRDFNAPIYKVVYINPALNRNVRIPKSFEGIDVWHNPHDWIVSLAKWLPFHIWGDAGQHGITRYDPRLRNYNITNYLSGRGNAHSKKFTPEVAKVLGPIIAMNSLQLREDICATQSYWE